ncbi:RNA polymerase sigma factor [Leucobacter tardus]|uniref:RNA polymerase sigma factor n=1 Tax=Leucobacter tardus TaxID=501483 RepID=A0A939QI54_9MICO|nr:RNA polymerase sigma factor [Leucobacter tardus]MBO2990503.1 RNA polymerase sigma factor [Leucobacter tardus]
MLDGTIRASTNLEDSEDRIVVGRCVDGDVAAFSVLVRRYTPLMRAYARRMLSGSADVDDIVQDVFVAAWHRLPELREPEKVKSWLMRLVSHRCIDHIRRTGRETGLDGWDAPAEADASPSRVAENNARLRALGEALRSLPEDQRECWVLRELGELSYGEISSELDVPVSTVRGLIARARKSIIVRMEAWR